MGWIAAKSLFELIELAKSTETDAIIKGLESWKGGTAANPYYWRKGDHQMLLQQPGGAGEAEDHRQMGLFRRQGRRAGERRRSGKGLRRQANGCHMT